MSPATATAEALNTEDHVVVTDVAIEGKVPLRMRTNTAEIDNTIIHPGSVKINVQGAFIVDQEASSPGHSPVGGSPVGGSYETKDIRLPNHTAVVSHIAVDVSDISVTSSHLNYS